MITGSSYALSHLQIDGRRYVQETHTLDVGGPIKIEYLALALLIAVGGCLSMDCLTIPERLDRVESQQRVIIAKQAWQDSLIRVLRHKADGPYGF
jgi:hypothetical protein